MSVSETTGKINIAGKPGNSGLGSKVEQTVLPSSVNKIKNDIYNGNVAGAGARTAKSIIQLPYDVQTVVASGNKAKQIMEKIDKCSKVANNDKTSFLQYLYKDKELRNFLFDPKTKTTDGVKVDGFRFFPPETLKFMENKCPNSKGVISTISAIDKNLLDTKAGQGIVKAIDKNAKITFSSGQNLVNGSKGAVFAADTLGKIPILSVALSTGLEIPEVVKAYKNGDFGAQVNRSATNIACTTVTSAAMGTLMAPLCPPFGSIAGFTIGSYLGHKMSKAVGDKMFGKSIEEQKNEEKEAMKSKAKPEVIIA